MNRHVHSAQTPEEKTFWVSLSDSVNEESVLVQVFFFFGVYKAFTVLYAITI